MLSAAYRTPSATTTASTPPPPSRISSGGMHAGPKGGTTSGLGSKPPSTAVEEADAEAAWTNAEAEAEAVLTSGAQTGAVVEGGKMARCYWGR